MSSFNTNRRQLLKLFGVASGGLVVGVKLSACSANAMVSAGPGEYQPNAFLYLDRGGDVVFVLAESEMGQGVSMGLATLVAEELCMHPGMIRIVHAPPNPVYRREGSPLQVTGGSSSIRDRYIPLRKAAAQMNSVLLDAAARQLNLPRSKLRCSEGFIHVGDGVAKHPIGDFIETAQSMKVPVDPPLRNDSEHRFIGSETTYRPDALAKVTGRAEFGIDVQVPNMKKAALLRCPVLGGTLRSYDANGADTMAGVDRIVPIFNGVAVVADHYWQAKAAVARIQAQWDLPPLAQHSSADIDAMLARGLDSDEGKEAHKQGVGGADLSKAAKVLRARYSAPYLAHATMEPMNCTAHVSGDRCEVWAPTQGPDMSLEMAEKYSGVHRDNITVHTTYLGGGFGRRANQDYVAEAVSIARQVNYPVQLVWSREDDMRNDFYRPAAMADYAVGVDESGMIETLTVKRAGPNIMPYIVEENAGAVLPQFLPQGLVDWIGRKSHGVFENWTIDPASMEGLFEDYDAPNKLATHVTVDPGLRCGFWRSVGHSFSGFFLEGMMDELAVDAGIDPLEYRLKHARSNPRLRRVLEEAADAAGWGKPAPGRFQGIAAVNSFFSYVAEVAEVSVENGQIRVHKVTCAVDCGKAINPDVIRAQMMSGIIFGLTAALHGDITLDKGAVSQSNFHDYPIARMNEAPEIEVVIVDSKEPPTGVGEPGLPPIAPAVGNAVFAATGQRLRSLPLKLTS